MSAQHYKNGLQVLQSVFGFIGASVALLLVILIFSNGKEEGYSPETKALIATQLLKLTDDNVDLDGGLVLDITGKVSKALLKDKLLKVQADSNSKKTTYTVTGTDTLFTVSEKVYGDGKKYMMIYEANKDILKTPDIITKGQVLKIPRDP